MRKWARKDRGIGKEWKVRGGRKGREREGQRPPEQKFWLRPCYQLRKGLT